MAVPDPQRLYDWMAPLYGSLWRAIPLWQRYSRMVLRWMPASGQALEVGPGPGLVHRSLAERPGVRAVAVDLSRRMLEQARANLGGRGRLVQARVEDLPLLGDRFCAVCSAFTLTAVPDAARAVREMARVLAPRGRLVLIDAGVPADRNLGALALACVWSLFGDRMRDQAALARAAGLELLLVREFGPFRALRLVVARKQAGAGCDDPAAVIGR